MVTLDFTTIEIVKGNKGEAKTYLMVEKYKVLIVDDHPLARVGIKNILETQNNIEIVGLLSHAEAVIPAITKTPTDAIFLDLNLPDKSGMYLIPKLTASLNQNVIIITGYINYKDAILAQQLGVKSIVSKSDPPNVILKAFNRVMSGNTYVSPAIETILRVTPQKSISLTPRQMAVLYYLSKGESNKEIGYLLNISAPTVSFHLHDLKLKLNVKGNRKILRKAQELDLI